MDEVHWKSVNIGKYKRKWKNAEKVEKWEKKNHQNDSKVKKKKAKLATQKHRHTQEPKISYSATLNSIYYFFARKMALICHTTSIQQHKFGPNTWNNGSFLFPVRRLDNKQFRSDSITSRLHGSRSIPSLFSKQTIQ